jgi:hypothetical protein
MWAHVLLFSPSFVLLPNISTLKYVKCNFDYCVIGVRYIFCLRHGSHIRVLLACTMWPMAAFLNNVCNIKITQHFRWLHILLMLFIHMRPENQSVITSVALCHKKVGDPFSRREN